MKTLLVCLIAIPVWGAGLEELIEKPYLDLLNLARPGLVNPQEAERVRQNLEKRKHDEQERLRAEEKKLAKEMADARKQLTELNRQASKDTEQTTAQRRDLHCKILRMEKEYLEKKTEREHGVPLMFENKLAKLALLEKWPGRKGEIESIVRAGRARQRPHGDVEDIGFRKISENQEKDIKLGEDAIREMTAYGLMPHELDDKKVAEYVRQLTEIVAIHSDLKIPAKVKVLESKEINAFALPGGFLFLNTGLLQKAESESELVGVIAHELAHAAGRHGHRLMVKATIASIIYQAAQVAALIFTGGAVGIGTYYALQYGFFGLGMVLNLTLLGVNREFEAEADQLGVQYAWKAGYDPRGFITFFDKMAKEEGYVKSVSWFRTHPPFLERILSTFSEIEYLGTNRDLRLDSTAFQEIKQHLDKTLKNVEKRRKDAPTLRRLPECDEPKEPGDDNRHEVTGCGG